MSGILSTIRHNPWLCAASMAGFAIGNLATVNGAERLSRYSGTENATISRKIAIVNLFSFLTPLLGGFAIAQESRTCAVLAGVSWGTTFWGARDLSRVFSLWSGSRQVLVGLSLMAVTPVISSFVVVLYPRS